MLDVNKPNKSDSVLEFGPDDGPVTEDPRHSYTIPSRYYTDSEVYEHEKAKVFSQNWWLVGHESRIPNPGDYVATRIFEQPIIAVRGKDNQIRAFYNVCKHRGHELALEESGHFSNLIVCPYHAWAYDFDGNLQRARSTDTLPGFQKCDFGLQEVRCESFLGFVFVNLAPDSPDLNDMVEDLGDSIRSIVPRQDQLTYSARYTYNISANWKVVTDNFLECYHCEKAHPALVDLMEMDTYEVTRRSWYSSHIAEAPKSNETQAYNFTKGDVDFGYAAWFFWPNTTFWAFPGEPNLMSLQIIPNGPHHTIEHLDVYLLDPEPSQQMKDAIAYMDSVLQPEDIGLCESAHRGLCSNGYNQGRLVVDPEKTEIAEWGVHHFHRLVVNALHANESTDS